MGYGIDTAAFISDGRLRNVIAANRTFIGRYLNPLRGWHDHLTVNEAKLISRAGLYVVSIFQENNSCPKNKKLHFTAERGIIDARSAVRQAETVCQPGYTPIYFAIDYNTQENDFEDYIFPYVNAIVGFLSKKSNNPEHYLFGVYGSKRTCKNVRGNYSATERYTWMSYAWRYPSIDFDDWNIKQTSASVIIGAGRTSLPVDYDESASVGGGGWRYI